MFERGRTRRTRKQQRKKKKKKKEGESVSGEERVFWSSTLA
jgi:hypothetical protein